MNEWTPAETSTHQDHVIAHVVGATVLGYLVLDETLHILLDIGFVWTIYLDGQMVLLPRSAAIAELEVNAEMRRKISQEADLLESRDTDGLRYLVATPLECVIEDVQFFAAEERRRLVVIGEAASFAMETSLETGSIEVKFLVS